jgi:hypothetical protein
MEQGRVNYREGADGAPDAVTSREQIRQETLASIRHLHRTVTIELLAVACFLLISIAGLSDFSLLPSLPGSIRTALGRPPSAAMIGAVLLLYVFSAIILVLSRMMSGSGKYGGFSHAGYLAGF